MDEENKAPTWAMITFTLSCIALFVAVMSSAKQQEMATKCKITPK